VFLRTRSAERIRLARVPIPDSQTLMRPALSLLSDGEEWRVDRIRETLATQFDLTEAELEQRSGRQRTFTNRVAWALAHMKGAQMVDRPRRGVYRITQRGNQVLAEVPDTERVDRRVLSRFEEYRQFRSSGTTSGNDIDRPGAAAGDVQAGTPTERIQAAHSELRAAVVADVLERVREQSPDFSEQVVLDVLQAIDYGGSREDAARRLGKAGEEGVDGVISEALLGVDLICVQAKRWANTVGRPEIQQFEGALKAQRASKGAFITTSSFSRDAVDYADSVNPRVVLVDGKQLAELMFDHGVGVSVESSYEIKRVDLDYFGADEDSSSLGGG
jgi:restriction system protein